MGKLPICFSKRLFWAIKWHAVWRDNMNSESFCTSSSVTHHTDMGCQWSPWVWPLVSVTSAGAGFSTPAVTHNQQDSCGVCYMNGWHTVQLGRGKVCGRGNAILHSPTNGIVITKALHSWASGMSGNRETTLWTRSRCHGSEDFHATEWQLLFLSYYNRLIKLFSQEAPVSVGETEVCCCSHTGQHDNEV